VVAAQGIHHADVAKKNDTHTTAMQTLHVTLVVATIGLALTGIAGTVVFVLGCDPTLTSTCPNHLVVNGTVVGARNSLTGNPAVVMNVNTDAAVCDLRSRVPTVAETLVLYPINSTMRVLIQPQTSQCVMLDDPLF
jgi:hypothetical protein